MLLRRTQPYVPPLEVAAAQAAEAFTIFETARDNLIAANDNLRAAAENAHARIAQANSDLVAVDQQQARNERAINALANLTGEAPVAA